LNQRRGQLLAGGDHHHQIDVLCTSVVCTVLSWGSSSTRRLPAVV